MNPTEKAHQAVRNLLLNGRILVNGIPPTAIEITEIIQGEQMLFEKATKFDAAAALAAKNAEGKDVPRIIPIKNKTAEEK